MPIKKSFLEKKWYYRVAKILFLILPFLVAVVVLLNKKINISGISQKNILDILEKNIVSIAYIVIGLVLYFLILRVVWKIFLYIAFGGLEDDTKKKDSETMPVTPKPVAGQVIPIIIIVGIIVVFALSQAGYIKLPKLDFNPGDGGSHQYGAACKTSEGKTGIYGTNGTCYTCSAGATAVTNPVNNCSDGIAGVYCCSTTGGNNGGNGGSKCIPTGCGSMWYCSGSYYLGGQQIRVNGCLPIRAGDVYPSWTGMCRQCP